MKLKEILRRRLIQPVLIWLSLTLAQLATPSAATYTLEHMSTDTCGAVTSDPYYYAYNSYPGFEYQIVALSYPNENLVSMAIGGRTTNCKALNPGACPSDVGAFIMLYNELAQTKPTRLVVVSRVQTTNGDIDVVGILGLKVKRHEDFAVAVGIFETLDHNPVVFQVLTKVGATDFEVMSFDVQVKVCKFTDSQIAISYHQFFSLVFQDCTNDHVHYYRAYFYDNKRAARYFQYKPEYRDGDVFEQIAVADYDSNWGDARFYGILKDRQGTRSFFIQKIHKYNLDWKRALLMDSQFEATHGANWSIFSARTVPDFDGNYRFYLEQQPAEKFMIIYEKDEVKTFGKNGCSFKIESIASHHKSEGWGGYASLLDQNTGQRYLFNEKDEGSTLILLQSRATSPNFDWISRLTDVVTSYNGDLIGFSKTGLGYAFKSSSSDNPQRCVNMLQTEDNSIVELTATQINLNVVKDEKDVEFRNWGQHGFFFNKVGTNYDVTEFQQDPKVNNPCQIRPGVTQQDVTVAKSVATSTQISTVATFLDTCPDGTNPSDIKVVIDSVFNLQTFEQGQAEIQVDASQPNTINVQPMTQEGSYSVSFQQGIAGEADAEITSRKASSVPQPFYGLHSKETVTVSVGSIPSVTCNSVYFANIDPWSANGPLVEVLVGSSATFAFTRIENSDCPYSIFVDSNQAELDSGAAWTQFQVTLTQPTFQRDEGSGQLSELSKGELIIDASKILADDAILDEVSLTVIIAAQGTSPSIVQPVLKLRVKLNYCQAFDQNLATVQETEQHYTYVDQTALIRGISRNQHPACAKTEWTVTSTVWPDAQVYDDYQVTDQFVQVNFQPQIPDDKVGTSTITVQEKSVGYPAGFTASQDLVLEVLKWNPCDNTGGFLSPEVFQPSFFNYYSQSNSTLAVTIGGADTEGQYGYYKGCAFDDGITFSCKTCGLDSDAIQKLILDDIRRSKQGRGWPADGSDHIFLYQVDERHQPHLSFKVRTDQVDEYYLKYRATPRWPDENFFCPIDGSPCQGFFEYTLTIDVNNVACASSPYVNRTVYPLTEHQRVLNVTIGAHWPATFKFGDVSNGECGYAFGEPYLHNPSNTTEVAMWSQFSVSIKTQPEFKVSDGSIDRKVNYETKQVTLEFSKTVDASLDTINGTFTVAMDVEFFNSGQTIPILFGVNQQYCEISPWIKSENGTLNQLTGSDSFDAVTHNYKHQDNNGYQKFCAVTTLVVVNDADGSTPDPRVFDIAIQLDTAQITVKKNIDDSLAGVYLLKILLTDFKFLKEWTRFVTVNLEVKTDCSTVVTPAPSILPYYKYFIDASEVEQQQIELDYTGFAYGTCNFEGLIELTCATCAELTSDAIQAQMNATTTLETTSVDPFQILQSIVVTPATVVFGKFIGLNRFGSYNITYTLLDFNTKAVVAKSTSEMFVTDNICNQDAKVNRTLYPLPGDGVQVFRKSVTYEKNLKIIFSGISNGDCDWQMQAIPTVSDPTQAALFEKGSATMELIPVLDAALNEKVITFDYMTPSIADVPDQTVFTLAMNVTYTSTAKVETITFEISLEYCSSIWPNQQAKALVLEQSTQSELMMFYTFNKVNLAVGCSKTRLQLIQVDEDQTQISLRPNLFDYVESEDGSEFTLILKDFIATELAGTYFLQIREIHLTDDDDFYLTNANVTIFSLCSLCSIAPVNFGPVEPMHINTLVVPFSWDQFWLEPILTEKKTKLVSQKDCHLNCLPFVKNVTIATEYEAANKTSVAFSSDQRTAYLSFPRSMLNLRANISIPFEVNITEQIVSDEFDSAQLRVKFDAEFIYIVPPNASIWENGSINQVIEALFGLPTLIPEPDEQYEFFVGDSIMLQFGEAYMANADVLSIEVDLEQFANFLKFNRYTSQITSLQSTTSDDIGMYKLKVDVLAETERATLVKSYDVAILVSPRETEIEIEEEQLIVERTVQEVERQKQLKKMKENISVLDDEESLANLPPALAFRIIDLSSAIQERGVSKVQNLVNRQKDLVLDAAIEKQIAEIRFKEISVTGKIDFFFTKNIEFPDDIQNLVQQSQAEGRRMSSYAEMINVIAGVSDPGDNFDEDEDQMPQILASYDLLRLNKEGVSIKLYFKEPLEVSQGDTADKVFVQFNFGQFKDSSGNQMPESIIKSTMIPRQAASAEEAAAIDSAGTDASTASSVTMIGGFFGALFLSAAMNFIWGMLDNLQIVTHLPLIRAKSPANANEFNQFFLEIASLQLIEIDLLESSMYFPETEPFSLEFLAQGYDSTFMLPAMGLVFYILCLYLFAIVTHAILWLVEFKVKKVAAVRRFLSRLLYWGPLSRFFMESYMELSLLAFVNLETMFWHSKLHALNFSNVLGLVFIVTSFLLPIFMVAYVAYKVEHWDDDEFKERNGALLEGLSTKWRSRRKSVLFLPTMYFTRRMIFVLTVVYFPDIFWVMIACQFAISTSLIIFLLWDKPLESKLEANLQAFNECTTLCVLYSLLCFSDFVPEAKTRSMLGLVFVGIVSFNVCVHMINVFVQISCETKTKARNWWHNFRVKEELELRAQREEERKNDPEYIEAKARADKAEAQLDEIMEVSESEEEDKEGFKSFSDHGVDESDEEWIQYTLAKARTVAPVPVDYEPQVFQKKAVDLGMNQPSIEMSKSLADSLCKSEPNDSESSWWVSKDSMSEKIPDQGSKGESLLINEKQFDESTTNRRLL